MVSVHSDEEDEEDFQSLRQIVPAEVANAFRDCGELLMTDTSFATRKGVV